MSGARGIVTAFARILVSEPCRPLGSSILRTGLGCRLSVPGLSGNSPDFHPPLARRRAFFKAVPVHLSSPGDEKPPVQGVGRPIPAILIMIHNQRFGRSDQGSQQRGEDDGTSIEEMESGVPG